MLSSWTEQPPTEEMKRTSAMNSITVAVAAAIVSASAAAAPDAPALKAVRTISLPNVVGRIDHLAVDVKGQRLFVCALGNDSVEVVDLRVGLQVRTIKGLGAPQGVAYIPELDRLIVANDKDGKVNFYEGRNFRPAGVIDLKDDADNVRYDPQSKRVYVGYGSGGLAVLDAERARLVQTISLTAHPESFQLEGNGPRIYVNLPEAHEVAVVDRRKGETIAKWSMGGAFANFPMALDEKHARLFIGFRRPAKLVVLDTASGKILSSLGISGDVDDIFYDAERKRLYAICGAGVIDVIEQRDTDHYEILDTIRTAVGARTGLFLPELNALFVAVPRRAGQQAELRQYDVK